MTDCLSGKTILISGGSGRIGSAFCRAIVEHNGSVIIADIAQPRPGTFEHGLDSGRVFFVMSDVTHGDQLDIAIKAGVNKFGKIDAAVHCAYPTSDQWGAPFETLEPEGLNQDLGQQLGGAILFSQRVIAHFVQQGFGQLIHVSSIQGIAAPKFWHYENTGMTSPIEYTAIKAGVIAITKYLAKLYSGRGLRINCISPGGILDRQPNDFLERYRSSCNSKGMLDADDLAGALVFLLSDEAKFISGQNLVIDDGWSL